MADLLATFTLERQEEIQANFELDNLVHFDAVFQITAPITWHNDLLGRSEEDCHPISAITGLEEALANAGTQIYWRTY